MGKYDDAIGEISVILSVDEVLNEDSANKVDKRIKEQTKEREIPLRINTDQALKDLEGLVKAIKNTSNNLANSISNGKSLKAIQNQINNYNELQHRIESIGDAIGKTSKEYKEAQKIINKTNKLINGTVISKKEPQKRQPKKQSITPSDDVIKETTNTIVEQLDATERLVEVQEKQAKAIENTVKAQAELNKAAEKNVISSWTGDALKHFDLLNLKARTLKKELKDIKDNIIDAWDNEKNYGLQSIYNDDTGATAELIYKDGSSAYIVNSVVTMIDSTGKSIEKELSSFSKTAINKLLSNIVYAREMGDNWDIDTQFGDLAPYLKSPRAWMLDESHLEYLFSYKQLVSALHGDLSALRIESKLSDEEKLTRQQEILEYENLINNPKLLEQYTNKEIALLDNIKSKRQELLSLRDNKQEQIDYSLEGDIKHREYLLEYYTKEKALIQDLIRLKAEYNALPIPSIDKTDLDKNQFGSKSELSLDKAQENIDFQVSQISKLKEKLNESTATTEKQAKATENTAAALEEKAEAAKKASASNQKLARSEEELNGVIKNSKDWIVKLNKALDDNNFKTSGKRAASEQLKLAYGSLMAAESSTSPGSYDLDIAKVRLAKAYQEAQRQNVAQSTLNRYDSTAIYSYEDSLKILQEERALREKLLNEAVQTKYQRSFGKGVVSASRKNTAALIEETSAAQGAITSYEELYAVLERYVDVARQLKPTTLPEMSEVESLMQYDVHSEDLKSTAKAIQARYKNVQSIKSSQKQGLSIYSHIDDDGKQKYEERIYSNTLKDAQNELDGAIYNSVYAYSDSIDEFLAEFTQKKVKNYVQELYNRFSELEKQDDAYRLEAESFNAPLEDIMNKISERIGATDYNSKQYQILDQLRYRANDVDRYTLSVEANHIGKLLDLQTPYKEIEANAKRIKSYDELCSAVERCNTLNKKAYAYAKGTYDTLNESEEMERRELLSRFSASGVDNLRDYSNFNQISNINKLAAAMNLGEIDETFAQLQNTQALIQDLRTRYDKQAFKDVFGDIEEVSIANASQIYDTLIAKDQEHAKQLAAAATEAERTADAAQKELAATTGTTQEKKKQTGTSSKKKKQTNSEDNTEDEPSIPTPLDIVEKSAEEALKILNSAQQMKSAIANYANISDTRQLEEEVRRTANEILGADLTMGATSIQDSRANLELFNKELGITVKQVWQLQQEGDSTKFTLDSTFAKQDAEKAQKYLEAQQKALDNSNKWANNQLARLEKYQRNYKESSKKISGDTSLLNVDDTSMTADIDKTIDGLASHIENRIRSSMNTNIAQSMRNEIERDLDILNSEIAIQQMRKYSSSTMKPSEIEAIRKNFENTLNSIETKAKKDNIFDQVNESIQTLRNNLDSISDSPSVGKFVDDLRVLRSSVEVAKAQEQQLQSVLKVQNELYDATKKHEKLKINKDVNSSDATQQARVVDEVKKRYDTAKKLLSTEAQTAQILEREKVLQQEVQQLVAETQAQKAKKNAEAEAKARQEILDSFWENKFQNEYKYTNGKTSKDQVELDAMGNYYKKLDKDAKALEQQVAKVKKVQDDLYTTKLKYETLKTNGASEAELAAAQRLVSEKAKQLEIEFSLINAVKQREELTNRELTLQDELNNKVTAGMEAKMNSMNNTVNNKAGSLNGFGNVDGAQQAADALNNMADAQERFNQATTGLPAKRQAYNDFYQEYGNFNSNFDYAKNNNKQKTYDIKDTKKTYNELLKYANDINQINNTLTDLTLKDEGNGTYSNALQILEGKKNAILEDYVELQSAINQKFNTTNGIDAFLENAREKGALTSAEIEKLNSLLREAGQISLDFYTKINSKLQPTFDKLSNLNDLTTSKKINNPDVAKQISDAYKAMDSKYQTFKENQDVQSAVDVMKFNNAMKEQVDLWYKAAQAEANYFANKRAYSADTTIGNVGDKARSSSNLNQDFTNMRESLSKAVQEFAGGEAIITGFRKSAEGIASLDFSVFDKGTNSMRQFTMEMGRMGQQAYITETSLSALEQSRKNASSQLSKSGSTWQSLQANNIDVNPDTAHSSVVKLREVMQQLQSVMQTSTEPKEIDAITRQAKIATAEVERLLNQSIKLTNTVGAEAIGTFKEDSTRMTDYDQLKAAVQSYASGVNDATLKLGKYNEKQNELNYTLTTGDGRVKHYTASVNKLDKSIVSQNTGVTRLKTGFQDLSGVVQMSAKRMLMFYAGYNIFSQVSRVMRQGVGYIKEIDAAMTELKKVTDETDASYSKFLSNAAKTGTQIGATTSEYVQAAANFARLGYSMNDAGDMGKSALVYKNVGDGISNVEEATNSIISTMKAFGVEAGDTMSIVDKFNEVKVPASLYGDIYDKDGYIGKTLGTDNSEERFNGNYLFFK